MLPLRSYWPALLLLSQEAYCLHRLADPASLVDWRCSCLCSELIPSVIENQLYLYRNCRSHRRRQLMMPFFQPELGWSVLEVVGLDQDCWRVELEDAGSFGLWQDRCNVDLRVLIVALLCKKNEEGGSARASPVAAPMPKSVSFLREKRDCEGSLCLCI